jgi:DNA-binding transcriptional ArsR family regulator
MPSSKPTPRYYDNNIRQVSKMLKSICNPTALRILHLLMTSEKRISEISRISNQSTPNVCQHISKMQRAGILSIDHVNHSRSMIRVSEQSREGLRVILQVLRTINDAPETEA